MPFHGVLPARRHVFAAAEPRADVGVSDAEAWRLNPGHRHVYDKLRLALDQGLRAAPAGVDPRDLGIDADDEVFVRPIVNLAGMALGAGAAPAHVGAREPGTFWCERLVGEQTSTDCLVRDGEALWFAHTVAGDERVDGRPLYWRIGVERPANEALVAEWTARALAGYTGLVNVEVIDGTLIEAHLRGSNGFFDFYGEGFIEAWVRLVDEGGWPGLAPVPGGYLFSLFGTAPPPSAGEPEPGVTVAPDGDAGRRAVIRSRDYAAGRRVLAALAGA